MDTTNVANVFEVVPNSVMTCGTAGASIDDTRGLSRNVNDSGEDIGRLNIVYQEPVVALGPKACVIGRPEL
ncbi:hypothetical protein ColTof4_05093 [Colletotrichum tofieldiae]|nr:hypothetical protein ColTof4_05093 [Colletotrichum tofieldiae]